MPKHVLSHNEIDEKGQIIAIHCVLEAFDLAFKINSSLGLRFIRSRSDITFKNNQEKYMVYKNTINGNGLVFWLYSNSSLISEVNKNPKLLFKEQAFERSLIPEFSKADYILKIIGENSYCNKFIKSLLLLPEILSCYIIPENKIKSKHNLIFD